MRIRFNECVLDTDRRQLSCSGRHVELSPKAYHLLTLLVEARPKALSKTALYESLWPNTFVVDANLSNLVGEIRSALGDSAQRPRYIRTLHGFGYAFSADAELLSGEADGAVPRGYLVLADGRAVPLAAGENVIGRGQEAHVQLDLPGISRRHARILIDDQGARLEDLDSKNGTFVSGVRVTTPVTLNSGDVVSLGSVHVTFHLASAERSTETA